MNKSKKKTTLTIILVLVFVTVILGVTYAWFNWQAEDTTLSVNTGAFVIPTTSPINEEEIINIESHLYESSWNSNETYKLVPGMTFSKDPYVGLGAGSEDAIVYVFVDNNFSNKVYFKLNDGWEAIEATEGYNKDSNTYTSGLFKYTSILSGSKLKDTWTSKPIFDEIIVDDTATIEDLTVTSGELPEIIVSIFLHQAKVTIGSDLILSAAKTAFGL